MMPFQQKLKSIIDDEDKVEQFLTAEQMIEFLNNLAKQNVDLSQAREVKWGV